jgi:hypothetical protein
VISHLSHCVSYNLWQPLILYLVFPVLIIGLNSYLKIALEIVDIQSFPGVKIGYRNPFSVAVGG